MVHMKTPFKNKNLEECYAMLKDKSIFFKSGISSEIENLVYSCLKFNPKERPTCADLLKHSLFDSVKQKKELNDLERQKTNNLC